MEEDTTDITGLLREAREGNQDSANRLLEQVEAEMRRIAARLMAAEGQGHTLQPTALINEAYIRIFKGQPVEWKDRAHFYAVVARQMRHTLVDHARLKKSSKRGSGAVKLSLDEARETGPAIVDVDEIDTALSELERLDPRAAKIVELRFFGGLTDNEIAEALQISFAKVRRDWDFARAWLKRYLNS